MPQMSPLMWLYLMVMFIAVYMMFNVMNYYFFQGSSSMKISLENESISTKAKDLSW